MRLAFAIPTKGRHAALPRTLALARRAADAQTAIILCDQSQEPWPGAGVTHRPDLNGLPAARNALLAQSTAEIVVFLDDDTDLAPDFASELRCCIARWPDAAGWGPVLETRPARIRRLHRLAHLGCFHDPRRLTGARIDAPTTALFGACFAVRRADALAVGFDQRRPGYALGEDLDFCRRLRTHLGNRDFRFCRTLRAIHRRDGAERADPLRRGEAKSAFLIWWARTHGRTNPATIAHLLLALVVAATGHGAEPATWRGVWHGVRRWWA